MPVLPPIAASTWPTSVVGTATHGTPRRYVAAANPADVGRAAAAEGDDRAAAIEPELAPQARDDRDRLRLLPDRSSCIGDEPRRRAPPARGRRRSPSRCCRRRAPPGRRRARARRAGRGRRARSGRLPAASTIPVVSVGDRVCRLAVDRLALGVEAAKLGLVARERALEPPGPLPRRVDVDLHQHGEGRRDELARLRAPERAAAERDHGRLGARERHPGCVPLDLAEPALAALLEQLGDRLPGPLLDRPVEVEELPAEPCRRVLPVRRLARRP